MAMIRGSVRDALPESIYELLNDAIRKESSEEKNGES